MMITKPVLNSKIACAMVFALLSLALTGCSLTEPGTITETNATETDAEPASSGGSDGEAVSAEAELAGDEASDEDGGQVAASPSTSVATTSPPPINMPDLIGLTEAEARSALQVLGVDEPAVTAQPSFEAPGTVLDQVPTAGRAVNSSVNLVVAESMPPMPDFIDQQIADVRKWASPLGIAIRTDTVLSSEKKDGQVVSQVPAAGAEVGEEILVTLAELPVIVSLANVDKLDGRTRQDTIHMDGRAYPETVQLSVGGFSEGWASYNLSRDWSTLRMEVGISDEHSFNLVAQLEVYGDGELLYSTQLDFGGTEQVDVDITGVLRLVITATKVAGDRTSYVGLGNAQLIGGSSSSG